MMCVCNMAKKEVKKSKAPKNKNPLTDFSKIDEEIAKAMKDVNIAINLNLDFSGENKSSGKKEVTKKRVDKAKKSKKKKVNEESYY